MTSSLQNIIVFCLYDTSMMSFTISTRFLLNDVEVGMSGSYSVVRQISKVVYRGMSPLWRHIGSIFSFYYTSIPYVPTFAINYVVINSCVTSLRLK